MSAKKGKGFTNFSNLLILYKSYVTEYQNDRLINRETTYNLNSTVV